MSGFKLIGIRPHKDCGEKFLKVLEPGRLYQFYNEYEFYTEEEKFDGVNEEIKKYKFKQTVPDDLYKVGNLNINISAVVGKNGTGKSTLTELLLFANYLIGINFKDSSQDKKILPKYSEVLKEDLLNLQETLQSRNQAIKNYERYISDCGKRISRSPIRRNFFEKRIFGYIDEIKHLHSEIPKLEKDIHYLKSMLNEEDDKKYSEIFRCSLFYSFDGIVYEISFKDKIELFLITQEQKTEVKAINLREHFFYSTILNYSHHSLNSNHIGYWINSLFHKNDGYKTPAVINPMRHEGNFDINAEIELSKSRLLVNSLINQLNHLEGLVPISDKQFIHSIKIKHKENSYYKKTIELKFDKVLNLHKITCDRVAESTISEILKMNALDELRVLGYQGKHKQIVEDLLNYLFHKLNRIQKNYPEYLEKISLNGNEIDDQIARNKSTINWLTRDFSHVSFKFHRSLFYLQKLISGDFDDLFKLGEQETIITLKDYLDKIEFINDDPNAMQNEVSNIFLRVPPPIFDVDFNLSTTKDSNENYTNFEELSSGEQQSLHTINTFIYHLNNTFSVHREAVGDRQKYNYFNAVFDEIELYFHPDFQRKFINDLIETIRKNKHLSENPFITGINVIFSTHSPFILSDIPEQNILKLEYKFSEQTKNEKKYSLGLESEKQTFGANIHDLLANEFFMTNGFMGEYSRTKIRNLISYLTIEKEDNFDQNKWNLEKAESMIEIVGEPFLKDDLNELLQEKRKSEFNSIDLIENEIRRLETLKTNLKKTK
jgi:hypothetical protein